MPEKPGANKEQKGTAQKGYAAGSAREGAYEFGAEIATPATKTPGTAKGTAGAAKGKEQKRPGAEE
ncbi:hypothetical protein MHLNE_05830 [Moorella humiferrea]|uniref:hypothetical protein n=1 Tax=Neomoorella humiferrea TaxID=676965 RepID=UPI0030CE0A45